jgi:hypothetical protein
LAHAEGLTEAAYERELLKFRDWARNQKPRVDWPASWRNWIRNVKPQDKGHGSAPNGRPVRAPVSEPQPGGAARILAEMERRTSMEVS